MTQFFINTHHIHSWRCETYLRSLRWNLIRINVNIVIYVNGRAHSLMARTVGVHLLHQRYTPHSYQF